MRKLSNEDICVIQLDDLLYIDNCLDAYVHFNITRRNT